MNISSTIQISELERSVPPSKDKYTPPKPKGTPKELEQQQEADPKVKGADPTVLKEVLAESDISLNFRRDDQSGRMVVEMIDNATGDAVMQIPNEVSLRLSEMFSKVQGQLFEARI